MAITKIEVPELFDFGSDNSAFKLPTGTTAERPTSPSNGEMRFNTTTGYVEYYDTTDTQWWEIDYEAVCTSTICNYPITGGTNSIALFQFENNATNTCSGNTSATTNLTYGTGKIGQAAVFSGSFSRIDWSNNSAAGISDNNNSFCAWVYLTSYSSGGYRTVITTQSRFYFYVAIAGSGLSGITAGQVLFSNDQVVSGDPGGGYQTASVSTIPLNTWTHIGVNISQNSGTKIFINGTLDKHQTARTGNGPSMTAYSLIGYYNSGSTYENPFVGMIDQVRVYNNTLSDADMAVVALETC